MKKILLSLIIFTSCNHQREESAKGHTEEVLQKADSALEQHNKIKEENLKVLEQVIQKYSADTLKVKNKPKNKPKN